MPPVLRPNVGGLKQVEVDGSTVGELLEALGAAWPGPRRQLFTPDGELNRFVNVYLNDQDVRYLQERATPVDPRDTLIILPAMAAGSAGRWGGQPPGRGRERAGPRAARPRTARVHPGRTHAFHIRTHSRPARPRGPAVHAHELPRTAAVLEHPQAIGHTPLVEIPG